MRTLLLVVLLLAGCRAGTLHADGNDNVSIVLTTSMGEIEIAVDPSRAPASGRAFLAFVDDGSFTRHGYFYRVVRKDENDRVYPTIDVVQGGWLNPPSSLPGIQHETTRQTGLRHLDGTVSLARRTDGTATGAAFFICIGDQPALDAGGGRSRDGQGFAAFGRVTRGMKIVRDIHRLGKGRAAGQDPQSTQMLDSPLRIVSARRKSLVSDLQRGAQH